MAIDDAIGSLQELNQAAEAPAATGRIVPVSVAIVALAIVPWPDRRLRTPSGSANHRSRCRPACAAQPRGTIRMRTGLLGRSVIRMSDGGIGPGMSSRSALSRIASTATASIVAKAVPMQMRDPAPNGMKA